jgi:phage terminase large subunit-like protein
MNEFQTDIPFCPHTPTPRQAEFLHSQALEVFFGGAAGGGKSVALLMAALQYVKHPGYAALIIRKDLPRLGLAGGLIPRSHEWLAGNKEAKWNQTRRQWQFPHDDGPPATITFGYLSRPLDKYRYASSEFQYIAFDELTDFEEDDYLFLFSRLRRAKHLHVPLRMRSASNPGGVGHLWVKQRFIDGSDVGCMSPREGQAILDGYAADEMHHSIDGTILKVHCAPLMHPTGEIGRSIDRLYIPSRISDNPHLDEVEYYKSLSHLPTVVRERLMNGDWSVQEKAIFNVEWLRYFIERHGQLELLEPSGRIFATIEDGNCRRFVTIDPAGTSADRAREMKGREASWSVLQVWDQPTLEGGKFLLLRHQIGERFGFHQLCQAIRGLVDEWRPWQIWIEGEKLGQATVDELGRPLPILCIPTTTKDKATRATRLVVKMERGEVLFPKHNSTWRPQIETELLSWTGHEREPADQIDAAAYAAIISGDAAGQVIKLCMPLTI